MSNQTRQDSLDLQRKNQELESLKLEVEEWRLREEKKKQEDLDEWRKGEKARDEFDKKYVLPGMSVFLALVFSGMAYLFYVQNKKKD